MTRRTFVGDVTPLPGEPLNANRLRGQTRYLSRYVIAWRAAGMRAGLTQFPRGIVLPVRIWVEVTQPDNRRRDTTNLFPTAKALVDGLVDAGVITDDADGLVEGPWLRRVYPNGPLRIRIVLQEIPPHEVGRGEPLPVHSMRDLDEWTGR